MYTYITISRQAGKSSLMNRTPFFTMQSFKKLFLNNFYSDTKAESRQITVYYVEIMLKIDKFQMAA